MNQINPASAGVFSLSPNPNFLYLTPALKAVIFQARGTIERRQGLVTLLADVGMGKSTILRYLIGEYDARADVKTVAVYTPKFPSTFGLIKEICQTFDLPLKRSLAAQMDSLAEYLAEQYASGVNIVLFIDEAQMLKDDLLEGVRGLLNLETNNAKLVQVVLAGQIELKARLTTERNRPLKSRIHSYALINPMTDKEMREMIDFRCNLVEIPNPFTDEAMAKIWDVTKGIPRHILKVCDKAVDYMNMAETDAVTLDMIDAAAEDAAVSEAVNE